MFSHFGCLFIYLFFFETDRKRLMEHAQCVQYYQLASSPTHLKLEGNLVTNLPSNYPIHVSLTFTFPRLLHASLYSHPDHPNIFRRLRKKLLLASSCLSIRPHGTTRRPLEGFSWKFIFDYFSKICRENSSFIKIRQECRVLYMKTNVHLW